jgi:putative two-component system response regulator
MSNPLDFTRQETVLLVDDSPDVLRTIAGLLRDQYEIRIANGGERALRVAATHPLPDLVLLDVEMPEMDGYETCRRLKADPETSGIPVIFLTAKTGVDDERRGFDAGCVDYITKPISAPILHARVKTHLSLKGARDFLRDRSDYLEAEVARRTREAMRAQAQRSAAAAVSRKLEQLLCAIEERAGSDPAVAQALAEIKAELQSRPGSNGASHAR